MAKEPARNFKVGKNKGGTKCIHKWQTTYDASICRTLATCNYCGISKVWHFKSKGRDTQDA